MYRLHCHPVIILVLSALLALWPGHVPPIQMAVGASAPAIVAAVPDAPSDVPWGG